MKVVLDTNVLVSGIFFSGPPAEILPAWSQGRFRLVVSSEIFDEYARVATELSEKFPSIDIRRILELVIMNSEASSPRPLAQKVCEDPHDDKIFAVAIESGAKIIVSGDKHLLKVSNYEDVSVLTPRQFVVKHLSKRP